MNHRKSNIVRWYTLGLAVLLAVGCLILATGPALARYLVKFDKELQIKPRALHEFVLGTVEEVAIEPAAEEAAENAEEAEAQAEPETRLVFRKADSNSWRSANGQLSLTFAVANSESETEYPRDDRHLQLRLVGSLGLWEGNAPMPVTLTVPVEAVSQEAELQVLSETEPTETTEAVTEPAADDPEAQAEKPAAEAAVTTMTFQGKAVRIREGSPLHHDFGSGWVFVFEDDLGQELIWELKGKKQSFIPFTITVIGADITDVALMQLQIIGEPNT